MFFYCWLFMLKYVKKSFHRSFKMKSFKVIVIGDKSVGKTSLTCRFCEDHFVNAPATTGLDMKYKTVVIGNEAVQLIIWDTAGTEEYYQALCSQYYRNVHGIILVYDLTRIATFKNLHFWLSQCSENNIKIDQVPLILVGSKNDCIGETSVSHAMGQRFANQHKVKFYETSSFLDSEAENIKSIFMTLAELMVKNQREKYKRDSEEFASTIKLEEKPNTTVPPSKGSSCC